jgi:CRP-like cAMP-binding protein
MNTLKYQPNDTIFKEGDDAHSFYIIVDGSVKIMIKNKEPIILEKGESFGENSFKKS